MAADDPRNGARSSLVHAWITGWTLARETAPPVPVEGGFRVDVGWPRQRVRYVFPRCCAELRRLAETISEPWVFLKVCESPAEMRELLPPRWIVQPVGFMMTRTGPLDSPRRSVPRGYSLGVDERASVPLATVVSIAGDVVASGRVAVVGKSAIYDRIETAPNHRRRGLGRALVGALGEVAQARARATGS